jgi:hypothetical protein
VIEYLMNMKVCSLSPFDYEIEYPGQFRLAQLILTEIKAVSYSLAAFLED